MFRFAITAALLALASPVFGQSFGTPAQGEIRTGWRNADGQHFAGLSIRLAPGWKTYWRAPGDGGIPPRFNWSGSQNLANVEVRFPIPVVLDQNGIQSIGYDRDVVFPLIVSAHDPSRPIQLKGEIEIGVCEEICIPMTLQVAAVLPETGARDEMIAGAMASRPKTLGAFVCRIEPIADGLRMVAEVQVGQMRVEAAVIEGGVSGTWISQPVLKRNGDRLMAEVEMVPPSAKPFALARSDVRLTVIGGTGAVEFIGCR